MYVIVQKKFVASIYSVGDGSSSFIRNVGIHPHDYLHGVLSQKATNCNMSLNTSIVCSKKVRNLVKVNSRLGSTHKYISKCLLTLKKAKSNGCGALFEVPDTVYNILEDGPLHSYRCENLKSNIKYVCLHLQK
jgi:hypothetical protein